MKKENTILRRRAFALIACAGSGQRTGLKTNKLLYCLGGRPIIKYTLDNFKAAKELKLIDEIIILCGEKDKGEFDIIAREYGAAVVIGGATRVDSVFNGLKFIEKEYSPAVGDIVLICDGARPNCGVGIIERCVTAAFEYKACVAAVPVADTIKTCDKGVVSGTLTRAALKAVQTPQAFDFHLIYNAYKDCLNYIMGGGANDLTDDSSVLEKFNKDISVHFVDGAESNYKITTLSDIARFSDEILKKDINAHMSIAGYIRIGIGSDTHRLESGRKLILGGEVILHPLGLMGHSDADALIHSIIDALLSALNLRDIGCQFPDTDMKYKDISSMALLEKTALLIKEKNAVIINISAVIHAEKPKLNNYIPKMAENIAGVLGINANQISISAKTGEKVGIIGEEKAISCEATCLIKFNN